MGNLRLAAAILFVAACGSDHANTPVDAAIDSKMIDAKVWMDAPPPVYDFSCMNNPAPANGGAAANVTLSGTAQEVALNGTTPMIQPAAGATLNACVAGAANCTGPNKLAGPVTSAADGSWSLGPIATSMNPLDGYVSMTKTGDRPTYIYPPQALEMDQGMIPALAFTTGAFSGITLFLQIQQDAGKGNLGIAVTDCANMPIDGATVSVEQNGTPVPNTTDLDAGMLSSQGAGVHLVFNVPVGDTTVSAKIGTQTLLAHVVHVFADSTTATIVRPGYF
jgi:hypothetical protein